MNSGATRESAQPRIAATGYCAVARAARPALKSLKSVLFCTYRALPLIRRSRAADGGMAFGTAHIARGTAAARAAVVSAPFSKVLRFGPRLDSGSDMVSPFTS